MSAGHLSGKSEALHIVHRAEVQAARRYACLRIAPGMSMHCAHREAAPTRIPIRMQLNGKNSSISFVIRTCELNLLAGCAVPSRKHHH